MGEEQREQRFAYSLGELVKPFAREVNLSQQRETPEEF